MELRMDGYCKRQLSRRDSRKAVYDLLADINMTPVGNFIWRQTYLGPSFYQLIMESHVAGDYWNVKGKPPYVALIVFSCKPFPEREVRQFLAGRFLLTRIEFYELSPRGFPPN